MQPLSKEHSDVERYPRSDSDTDKHWPALRAKRDAAFDDPFEYDKVLKRVRASGWTPQLLSRLMDEVPFYEGPIDWLGGTKDDIPIENATKNAVEKWLREYLSDDPDLPEAKRSRKQWLSVRDRLRKIDLAVRIDRERIRRRNSP